MEVKLIEDNRILRNFQSTGKEETLDKDIDDQKYILESIIKKIFLSDFGKVYEVSDIRSVCFYVKGDFKSLFVNVELNFDEYFDILDSISQRMKKVPEYLAVFQKPPLGGNTTFQFWYDLSVEDSLKFSLNL